MKRRCWSGVLLSVLLAVSSASAQKVEDPKVEAAARFDRGLTLFEEGDNAGALAEFRQAYAIFANPVVRYNIGLVFAAMTRPVDAADALREVVADTKLSEAQRERAKKTLAEQEARIGRLNVTTTPAGARIAIDDVEVATTPLTSPIRVASGSRIVGAVAEGYVPTRKEIVIAGNTDETLHFDLVRATAVRPASLTVRSRLTGADVFVNGKAAGRTPLSTSLSLPAGRYSVELRRSGYQTVTREIELAEGATGELDLETAVDPAALEREGVLLSVDVGAPVELFVDGEHLGSYTGPVRLPRGTHRVRVEAAGFLPLEREVTLDPAARNVLRDRLEPTSDTRAAHEADVRFHRTWGLIGIGAGALVTGGGVGYLIYNAPYKDDARKELEEANAAAADGRTGPFCNHLGGQNTTAECQAYVDDEQADLDGFEQRDLFGYIGIGAGAAIAVTGVVLLLTGEDADKYENSPSGANSERLRVSLATGPDALGATLSGSF
jgi:hypothetical protein